MEHLRITVEGRVYEVIVEKIDADEAETPITTSPAVRSASPAAVSRPAPVAHVPASGAGDAASPLAGIVQAIDAAVGSVVNEGDLVITLEAMKMYTPINAIASGTITAIHVKVGDAVEEGQTLYTIG